MTTHETSRVDELRLTTAALAEGLRALHGITVHLPGDDGYDDARTPWNLAHDLLPAAVVVPRDDAEVSAAMWGAAAAGLRVAPMATGHNAGPLAAHDLSGVLLFNMRELADVSYDPATTRMRVGGGAIWQDAVDLAAAHGRAVLHGSSPDVGVAGYSLSGGIGWYARKLGLAANSITAIEVVLADGRLVRADADQNVDLFWALRGGGGGNFGVVTALELATFPITTVYAGFLLWDGGRDAEVLEVYRRWAVSAPEEVSTSFRIMNLPPLPGVPDFLAGRRVVVVDGAVLGTDDYAVAVLAELRALAPEVDTFGRVPAHTLSRIHMDPEQKTPGVSSSLVLHDLSAQAAGAFLAAGPGPDSSLLFSELRQLGGALGRTAEAGGALSRLDGAFAVFACAVAPTPDAHERGLADARRLADALRPQASPRPYLNFVERRTEVRSAFPEPTWAELTRIRSLADPAGVLLANHEIPRDPVETGLAG